MAAGVAWDNVNIFKRQKGIAIVEFAVGVIVLLVVMLVVAEVGRAFYSYQTLTKAVRNGARYIASNVINEVSVVGLTGQKIDDTRNVVIYGQVAPGTPVLPSMVPGSIDVVQAFPSGAGTPYIEVTASYNYAPIFGAIPALGLSGTAHDFGFTMQARSTMRVLLGDL